MRILITGHTGFIGRELLKNLWLSKCDVEIYSISGDCDIRDEQEIKASLESIKPEIVFHLAANPNTKLKDSDPHGNNLWQTNVEGTRNLLKYAPDNCRFVFASSASVYGSKTEGNVDFFYEDDRFCCNSLYSASKAAAECLVHSYTELKKVRGVSLRLVANVGTGATHGVVLDIFNKLHSDSKELELLGKSPGSSKPYMHVSDTVKVIREFGFNDLTGAINVSPDDTMNIEEIAELAMMFTGIQKPIVWLGEKANWPGDSRNVRVRGSRQLKTDISYNTSKKAVGQALREMVLCTGY